MLSSIFISSEKDRLTFEIALDNMNELATIFCVCRKKDVKHMNKTYGDLKNITKPYQLDFMADSLTTLAEDKELFLSIFDFKENKNMLMNLYHSIESNLDIIYFTDRKTYSNERFSLFFSFDLNSKCYNNQGKFEEILKFIHLFVDNLSQLKQSSTVI